MSVILFSKDEVYQDMADSYEALKRLLLGSNAEQDEKFYKSLRRLYFANVATFLCQYHDDTPLGKSELESIDPFQEIDGHLDPLRDKVSYLNQFLRAWGNLQYNLVTNDGEMYKPMEAFTFIQGLAERLAREVIELLDNDNKE